MSNEHDPVVVEDDGLAAPLVGSWAREKYRRLGMYSRLFSTGMKNRWDQRVYLDLYAGSGFARLRDSGEILMGSPLIALTVPDPFTKYIFVEEDGELLDALRARVTRYAPDADVSFYQGDINRDVEDVVRLIPGFSRGNTQLSFAFVDPFSVELHFNTIERLASGRAMDFMILLALAMDANRNFTLYLDENHRRIEDFLGDPSWRERWREASERGEKFIYFLAVRYIEAMKSLGYLRTEPSMMYGVRSDMRNLGLYYLAFFSKNQLGYRFWKEVLKYSDDQLGLEF